MVGVMLSKRDGGGNNKRIPALVILSVNDGVMT